MFKLDNYRRNSSESSSHHTYPLKSLFVKDYSELNSSRNSNCDNAIDKTEKLSNIDSISSSSTCTIHEVPVLKCNRTIDKSADDFDTPLAKKAKILDKITEPLSLSAESRNWLARRVDLIIAPYSQYFYAMVGWTGNKHFNRDLRLYAQRVHNMKLTSHGLYDLEKMVSVPAETERQVFDNLRLDWREPDQRNC